MLAQPEPQAGLLINAVAKVRTALGSAICLVHGASLSGVRGKIDRLFEDFGRPIKSFFYLSPGAVGLSPVMDWSDSGKDYHLSAEMPGPVADDVALNVTAGILALSGKTDKEAERKYGGTCLKERRYGKLTPQITLSTDVHSDAVTAMYVHSVLRATLGMDKNAASRTQRIAIVS